MKINSNTLYRSDIPMTQMANTAWRATLILLIWLVLSTIWGALGAALGPGIVMPIVALLVGTVGTITSLVQVLVRRKPMTLYSGFLICACSVSALSIYIFESDFSYRGLFWVVAYVAVPSFLFSFFINLSSAAAQKSGRPTASTLNK